MGEAKRKRQLMSVPADDRPQVRLREPPVILDADLKAKTGVAYHLAALGGETWPVKQITLLLPGGQGLNRLFTFWPGDYLALFTGHVLERSGVHPVGQSEIDRLAQILRVEPDRQFQFDVSDVVLGYAALSVYGWHGPRAIREFLKQLESNPEATKAAWADDAFYGLLIAHLENEMHNLLLAHLELQNTAGFRPFAFPETRDLFRKTARMMRDEFRKTIAQMGKRDNVEPLFFQHIATMVRRLTGDLRLPGRAEVVPPFERECGTIRLTPLLEFAEAMHELLVMQIRAFGIPEDRCARLAGLSRLDMVMALERARAAIFQGSR
jgi:hypothetical protein